MELEEGEWEVRAFRATINQRVNGKGGRWLRTSITVPPQMAKDHSISKDDEYVVFMLERDELNNVERIKNAIDEMLNFAEMEDEVFNLKNNMMRGEFHVEH